MLLAYLGGDEELRNGKSAGDELDGLTLADYGRPRPIPVSAGIGHAGRNLLSQPNEDVTAIVKNSGRVYKHTCLQVYLP